MRGPSTGVFHMPVWTVLSCQATSRGRPTLTESKRPITFLSNDDAFGVEQKAPPVSTSASSEKAMAEQWIRTTEMIATNVAVYIHSDPFLRLGLNGIKRSLGR